MKSKRIFEKLDIEFYNNWEQLCGNFNWYTWTLAHIEYENDVHFGTKEFTMILFGLGFRLGWAYNNKLEKKMKKWNIEFGKVKL